MQDKKPSKNQLKMLTCSLVLNYLDYINAILVNLSDAITKQFQLVQNFAAKILLNKRNQDSATECLKEVQWLSVKV